MFAISGEINLWTLEDVVSIKDTDFGAFRYHDKRKDSVYEEGKRSYAQSRGMLYVPQNKKGNKLKDSIKYLEDQLRDNSTIYCGWNDDSTVQVMLSSGLLIQLQVNAFTGDVKKITFDKYLVGKISDRIADVAITKNHLVCTYNDSQVTVVHFAKPRRHAFEKIGRLEPKLASMDFGGPNGRRLEKKIQLDRNGDFILIWWKSTMNEVYPWSPTVKEHDRANVHLYRLSGLKLELLCYLRTEFDPLCITFDVRRESMIHSVEQKVSRKGEVIIEWRTYEVSQQDKLQRIGVISVPLPTHTSCVKFSPNHEMLLLCCIDGSITLHDQIKGTNNSVKAAFIPTLASWHSDGIVFTVGNERGQFQHFDISMSCIKSHILNEDATASNILDLSSYFRALFTQSRSQPALSRMEWNKRTDPSSYSEHYDHGDSLFLLLFERGPLGVIKIIEGRNLSGDAIVQRQLALSQVERATSLLLFMNWDTHPQVCMHSLNQILNYLFKLPLTAERESLIQNALGSFHVPVRPISQAVEDEYGDEVRDLTRRFFHYLVRHRLFEKAFRLAIDLNDHDLFMDIHFYAVAMKDEEMAAAARDKAEQILSRSNSCSSTHSTCSRPSCSVCSDSVSNEESESYSEESENAESSREKSKYNLSTKRNYPKIADSHIPPLPVLHPPLFNNGNLTSTPFNDASALNKTDNTLMSTAFNLPTNSSLSTSFNNPTLTMIPNGLLMSSPFNDVCPSDFDASLTSTSGIGLSNPTQTFVSSASNPIPTFGNTSIGGDSKSTTFDEGDGTVLEQPFGKPVNSAVQSSLGNTSTNSIKPSFHHNNFMSTSFNNSIYESVSMDSPPDLSLSSSNADSNVMSTSFNSPAMNLMSASYSNAFPNAMPHSTPDGNISSLLRNVKSLTLVPPANNFSSEPFSSNISTNKSTPSLGSTASLSLYDSGNNLMSTSFNDSGDNIAPTTFDQTTSTVSSPSFNNLSEVSKFDDATKSQRLSKKHTPADIPPPPSITNSYNYIHNLPKKNYLLSRSVSRLTDIDESISNHSMSRPTNDIFKVLQRQNSVSSILQNQRSNNNSHFTRTYRLNYDLDFVPFHSSCDNLGVQQQRSNANHTRPTSINPINHLQSNMQCKSYESVRHLKLGVPQSGACVGVDKEPKMSSNIPPLPVINLSTANAKSSSQCPALAEIPASSNEKPKVKFSDTVTHILVPGTGQSYRPLQKRSVTQLHPMDPKRELAESLPLCLGNEDYLKDFQPLSKDSDCERTKESQKPTEETAKIKVVHFGLL